MYVNILSETKYKTKKQKVKDQFIALRYAIYNM